MCRARGPRPDVFEAVDGREIDGQKEAEANKISVWLERRLNHPRVLLNLPRMWSRPAQPAKRLAMAESVHRRSSYTPVLPESCTQSHLCDTAIRPLHSSGLSPLTKDPKSPLLVPCKLCLL